MPTRMRAESCGVILGYLISLDEGTSYCLLFVLSLTPGSWFCCVEQLGWLAFWISLLKGGDGILAHTHDSSKGKHSCGPFLFLLE